MLPQYIVKLIDYLLLMQYFFQSLFARSIIVSRSVSNRYIDIDLNPFRGRIGLLCDFFFYNYSTNPKTRTNRKGVKVHAHVFYP